MKIRANGKEHPDGDPYCTICDAPDGERNPQICGVNHCTGLRHAERFGNDKEWEFTYRCDQCGEIA
jgi:hypothetical protein